MSDFLGDGAELFATCCVSDFERARPWYERLFGAESSFVATDTEAVWEVAPHRWVVVEERPEHAGHSVVTLYVADLDHRVAAAADRGVEPVEREIYPEGVRKMIYRDPDGNEIGYGGNPAAG